MAKKRNGSYKRKIDESVSSANKRLKSKFVLVPSMKIKTWKALIVIMFMAGFAVALVWSAVNGWYLGSDAKISNSWASDVQKVPTVTPPILKCTKAGAVVLNASLGPADKPGVCCTGLSQIDNGLVYDSKSQKCFSGEGAGMICSNCGNGKCEKWENSCNCQKDCPGIIKPPILKCKKAGEVVRNPSLGPNDKPGQCCAGLTEINGGLKPLVSGSGDTSAADKCQALAGAGMICSNCGNGKCENWENSCNCTKDCR